MASKSRNKKNGHWTIQFVGKDGKRRSIRLGKISKKAVESIQCKVESLVEASITGFSVDNDTASWVSNLVERLADKLARVGLIPKRERTTLGPFIDSYIKSRTDLKPLTIKKLNTTRDYLVEQFGANMLLRDRAKIVLHSASGQALMTFSESARFTK